MLRAANASLSVTWKALNSAGVPPADLMPALTASATDVFGREVLVGVDDADQGAIELGVGESGALDPGTLKRSLQALELLCAAHPRSVSFDGLRTSSEDRRNSSPLDVSECRL
jgi:hypothetical protein